MASPEKPPGRPMSAAVVEMGMAGSLEMGGVVALPVHARPGPPGQQ
jgi:hypothetical protein